VVGNAREHSDVALALKLTHVFEFLMQIVGA
jgi:hypothetical protein